MTPEQQALPQAGSPRAAQAPAGQARAPAASDASSAPARLHSADGVATLWLELDERGNALSAPMVETLQALVQAASADTSVHTLLLRSRSRHFCTGFDLGNLEAQSDGDLLARFVRIEMLLDAIWRAPLRTVALCAGRAWGAGADLFAACDLRLAVQGSRYAFPGAGFGLVLGTRRLAVRVGMQRTHDLTCEGTVLDAAQALQAGLASHLAATPEEAEALLATLTRPPATPRATVAALRAAALADTHGDADLLALVRSAAEPGLKNRIVQYRQAQLAKVAQTRG
ncbi:enoyl-CoA hydratase/isomerase family protein [Candidimonas nitroreducens]|nr:enoyl-CoA hydratase/isomerase family protein [Candidimonas nitroreducens]